MTYLELAEKIKNMSPEQQNAKVQIFDENCGELFVIGSLVTKWDSKESAFYPADGVCKDEPYLLL